MASTLLEVLSSDEFCVTALRGLGEAEVLERLGASAGSVPSYPMDDICGRLGFDTGIVQIYAPAGGEWAYIFDANGSEGWSQSAIAELSRGTEAVSVCAVLDFTTVIAHARDGDMVASYDLWLDQAPSGPEADGLERILTPAGFFLPPEEIPYGSCGSADALEAVEEAFGLRVDPAGVAKPLPTVIDPVVRS